MIRRHSRWGVGILLDWCVCCHGAKHDVGDWTGRKQYKIGNKTRCGRLDWTGRDDSLAMVGVVVIVVFKFLGSNFWGDSRRQHSTRYRVPVYILYPIGYLLYSI